MFRAVKLAVLGAALPATAFLAPMSSRVMPRSLLVFSEAEGAAPAEAAKPERKAEPSVSDPLAGLPDGLDIDGLFGEDLEMLSPLEDEPEELLSVEEIEALEPLDDGKGPVPFENPGWLNNAVAMKEAQEKFRLHENDSGSAQFQVARLTARITYMTAHAKRHPKDNHSRRGLITMVNKRRRLLNYMQKEDPEMVERICREMGIRFKPAGRILTRKEKYIAFKPRK